MECCNKIEIPTFSGGTVVGEIKSVGCLQYNSNRIITILINGLYYDLNLSDLLYNRLKIFDLLNIGKYVTYLGEFLKIIGFDKYSIFNNDPRVFVRKKTNEIKTLHSSNCDILSHFSNYYKVFMSKEKISYFNIKKEEILLKDEDIFYKKNSDIELEEIEPVITFKVKHLSKKWRIKKCC